MMRRPREGDRLLHNRFGWVKVLAVHGPRARVSVDKLNGLELSVEMDRLPDVEVADPRPERRTSGGRARKPVKVRHRPPRVLTAETDEGVDDLAAVEALRFGLVPQSRLEELTIGFDENGDWLKAQLPDENGGEPFVAEVWGQFGAGKTHTMAVLRQVAREKGYLTSQVEVDGKGVTLAKPDSLYASIAMALGGQGFRTCTPILDLYMRAIDTGHPAPSIAPKGIDRTYDNYESLQAISDANLLDKYSEELEAALSESGTVTVSEVSRRIKREYAIDTWDVKLRKVIGQKVGDRPYDFVEALVGLAVLAKIAGFEGLILTVDEFEVEQVGSANYDRVQDVIDKLTRYLQRDLKHRRAPLGIVFATVGSDSDHGEEIADSIVQNADGEFYELEELDQEALTSLCGKICTLYGRAYPDVNSIPEPSSLARTALREVDDHDTGHTRAFIKRTLAHLDSVCGPRRGN